MRRLFLDSACGCCKNHSGLHASARYTERENNQNSPKKSLIICKGRCTVTYKNLKINKENASLYDRIACLNQCFYAIDYYPNLHRYEGTNLVHFHLAKWRVHLRFYSSIYSLCNVLLRLNAKRILSQA